MNFQLFSTFQENRKKFPIFEKDSEINQLFQLRRKTDSF